MNAQEELNSLLTEEFPAQSARPEKDRVVFFQRLAMLYVRYIQIFRRLENVYDQVVHPQKRRVIRAILEGVMGRVLELKNEMVEKEFSEYHYMDDVLHDLKLTPVSLNFQNEYAVIGKVILTSQQELAIFSNNDIAQHQFSLWSLQADLEIPVPRYFISERSREVQERKTMLADILKMVEITESPEVS